MEKPILVALLFADRVIIEQDTHKNSIIGAFDRFQADNFPAVFVPWTVYAAVTNLEGKHSFTMTLVNDESKDTLLTASGEFNAANKLDVAQIVLPVGGVLFPGLGNYSWTFEVDGEKVGWRILSVVSLTGGKTT